LLTGALVPQYRAVSISSGPGRDLEPPAIAFSVGQNRWAATDDCVWSDRTSTTVTPAAPNRWLVLASTPGSPAHEKLTDAWARGGDPRELFEEGSRVPTGESGVVQMLATCAELTVDSDTARFRWVGLQRVVRIRDKRLEQLTVDHDVRWAAQNSPAPPGRDLGQLANLACASLGDGTLAEGRCDVRDGDRFMLLHKRAHQQLEAAYGDRLGALLADGSPHDACRWASRVLRDAQGLVSATVLFVDAYPHVERDGLDPLPSPDRDFTSPTVLELAEDPQRFAGRRVRTRGLVEFRLERRVFAGGWLTSRRTFSDGVWLVDVDGIWRCDPERGHGHFNQYPAELRGDARPVRLDHLPVVVEERISEMRPYEPFIVETELDGEQRLDGRPLIVVGAAPFRALPERAGAVLRLTLVVGSTGRLFVLDWTERGGRIGA